MPGEKLLKILAISKASVDEENRIVRGYACVWDVVDAQGDSFIKGSFADAIEAVQAGEIVKIFWQHQTMTPPVGKILKLKEDNYGLYFEAYLAKTERGEELLQLVLDKTIEEVSIGGMLLEFDADDQVRRITKVHLREVSLANWGAVPGTSIHKSMTLFEASQILNALDDMKRDQERIIRLLESEDGWGPKASTELETAIADEVDEVAEFIREAFAGLNGDSNAGSSTEQQQT